MYFTRTSKLLFFIQLIVVKLEQNNDKQINGNFRPKKRGRRVVIVTEDALWKWIAHSIHLTRWVSWISKYSFIRDGPLEKFWGGRGIFEVQEFFFVIKFPVWIFFRPLHEYFLGLIGVQEFFFI